MLKIAKNLQDVRNILDTYGVPNKIRSSEGDYIPYNNTKSDIEYEAVRLIEIWKVKRIEFYY